MTSTNSIHEARHPNPVLWDNFEGWYGMVGRREVQGGGGICILMADSRLLYGSNQHDIVKQLSSN